MAHGRVDGALVAVVVLALARAACATKPDVGTSELTDGTNHASVRLRFETVRSILEDSKGN